MQSPHIVRTPGNRLFTHFWAINIPGDATGLNDGLVDMAINGEKVRRCRAREGGSTPGGAGTKSALMSTYGYPVS